MFWELLLYEKFFIVTFCQLKGRMTTLLTAVLFARSESKKVTIPAVFRPKTEATMELTVFKN